MNHSIVSQGYWDAAYAASPLLYRESVIQLKEVFDRYVPKNSSCFEVGCYPGQYLIYLGRKFGCSASGIDLTPATAEILRRHIENQGVRVQNIYHGDFIEFQTDQRYDVVFSFGFIEHFTNFEAIIEKHVELLKPGGILILCTPNFRRGQFVLHSVLDRENLRRHVLRAMDFEIWNRALSLKGMKILESGYYRTFEFWFDSPNQNIFTRKSARLVTKISAIIDRNIDCPNSYFSPYLFSVSQRPLL